DARRRLRSRTGRPDGGAVRILQPLADPAAPLARRNPLAKLAAVFTVSVALVSTVDPGPSAVVLAAELAAVPLFGVRYARLARRARGVEAGRNPVVRGRLFASTMFALLVGAIRRGTRLATAMDARGFGCGARRTSARRSRFTAADAALVVGGLLLATAALLV